MRGGSAGRSSIPPCRKERGHFLSAIFCQPFSVVHLLLAILSAIFHLPFSVGHFLLDLFTPPFTVGRFGFVFFALFPSAIKCRPLCFFRLFVFFGRRISRDVAGEAPRVSTLKAFNQMTTTTFHPVGGKSAAGHGFSYARMSPQKRRDLR